MRADHDDLTDLSWSDKNTEMRGGCQDKNSTVYLCVDHHNMRGLILLVFTANSLSSPFTESVAQMLTDISDDTRKTEEVLRSVT